MEREGAISARTQFAYGIQPIAIGVAYNRIADREWIPKIRRILSSSPLPSWATLVGEVTPIPTGSSAQFPSVQGSMDWLNSDCAARLLIACGPLADEWLSLPDAPACHGEIILLKTGARPRDSKSVANASLLRNLNLAIGDNLAEKIRKALRRLSIRAIGTVRLIDTRTDMDRYLRLRYVVWKNHSYIPQKRIPQVCPIEVDHTDRNSIPLGLFSSGGEIRACARLVKEIGSQGGTYSRFVQSIVDDSRDPVVMRNFTPPRQLRHPFDLLDEFQGFQKYYSDLVRTRTRVGEVSRVIVLPGYEEHGIGEALVDCVIDLASQNKLQKLFLACHERHVPFYERCGFRPLPELRSERFLDIAQPSIIMERETTL